MKREKICPAPLFGGGQIFQRLFFIGYVKISIYFYIFEEHGFIIEKSEKII